LRVASADAPLHDSRDSTNVTVTSALETGWRALREYLQSKGADSIEGLGSWLEREGRQAPQPKGYITQDTQDYIFGGACEAKVCLESAFVSIVLHFSRLPHVIEDLGKKLGPPRRNSKVDSVQDRGKENKNSAKDVADEEETTLCPPPDLFWPEPRVRLSATLHSCPKGLLPSDAKLLKQRPAADVLGATTYPGTVKAATRRGLRAMEVPAFLGDVPSELKRKTASWGLLLVVGPSGSGKTSLLRSLAKQMCRKRDQGPLYPAATWTPGKPIVEQFQGGFSDAQGWMCAVGLSSVPTWCKPFDVLSVGEKYRVNVARALAANMDAGGKTPLIFDEWTSELDRGVARSLCVSLRRRLDARSAAGREHPPLLLATCHEDVEEFLKPDVVIVCQAGKKPIVKYMRSELGASRDDHRLRMQAVVRGVMEPMPAGGWILGHWHLRKLDQEFAIRFYNAASDKGRGLKKLSLHLAKTKGPDKCAIHYLQLADSVGTEANATKLETSRDWLQTRLNFLSMELRLRMRSPNQLEVQKRQVEDDSALQTEIKELQAAKRYMNELAGEGKATRQQASTFKREFSFRLKHVEKQLRLKAAEQAVLKTPPGERSDKQKNVVQNLQERVAAKLSEKELELNTLLSRESKWGPLMVAERSPFLSAGSKYVFGEDADDAQLSCGGESGSNQVGDVSHDYGGYNIESMKRAGWYIPEGLGEQNVYPGLVARQTIRCTPEFCLDPRKEDRPAGLVHLASYVGEADGSLSSSSTCLTALEEAARLLDDGFSGLCVHVVPQLEGHAQNKVAKQAIRNFRIGMILGPSGSGKSSLARERFGAPFQAAWDENAAALAHFQSLEEAEPALEAAALDLKTSMLPAGLLSGGERERATLARGLAEWASGRQKTLIIEEFTSLVDRPIAHKIAKGVAAFVESHPEKGGLVFLSCHTDVVGKDLLAPDWVFDAGEGRFMVLASDACRREAAHPPQKKRKCSSKDALQADSQDSGRCDTALQARIVPSVLKRPASAKPSVFTIRRALPCEWRHFRDHHYKDHRLMMSAIAFVGVLEGRLVAFSACIYTGLTLDWLLARDDLVRANKLKKELRIPASFGPRQVLREHRTVVVPDSQGLGLGSLIADAVAHVCTEMGYVFQSTTAHPTYGGYRDRSKLWATLPSSQRERTGFQCSTFSHVWVGAHDKESAAILRDRVTFEGSIFGCV